MTPETIKETIQETLQETSTDPLDVWLVDLEFQFTEQIRLVMSTLTDKSRSLRWMARRTEVDITSLSKAMNGKRYLTPEKVMRLHLIPGVDREALRDLVRLSFSIRMAKILVAEGRVSSPISPVIPHLSIDVLEAVTLFDQKVIGPALGFAPEKDGDVAVSP